MLRDLAILLYASSVVLSVVLSDGPPAPRAGLAVVWGFACVVAVLWRVTASARLARGRAWAKAGRCAACGYRLDHGMRVCPECGQRAR